MIGVAVAVVPALVGGTLVAAVARRHRAPLNPEAVAIDLAHLFARIVVVLVAVGIAMGIAIAVGSIESARGIEGSGLEAFGIVVWATVVTIALLRRAALALTRRLALAHGWSRSA